MERMGAIPARRNYPEELREHGEDGVVDSGRSCDEPGEVARVGRHLYVHREAVGA
jgi:hypothetical protein